MKFPIVKRLLRLLIEFLGVVVIFYFLIVFFQDIFILPASLSEYSVNQSLPRGVQLYKVPSEAGFLETYKYLPETYNKHKIVLFFPGNGEILPIFSMGSGLTTHGYTVYSANYRGVGESSGSFSEKKVMRDSLTLVKFITEKEHIPADELIIAGYSLGTGLATYTATQTSAKTLLLLAPYRSLPDVVRTKKFFRFFTPFLRTKFPSEDYIMQLPHTCKILVHGKKDTVIPYERSLALKKEVKNMPNLTFLSANEGDHASVFYLEESRICQALDRCLNRYSGY